MATRSLYRWCVTIALCALGPVFGRGPAAFQSAPVKPPLVNLNSASQAELAALPGIGAAMATKIIAARPFATVADLSKAGVPAATIKNLESRVTVAKQPMVLATTATVVQVPGVKGHVWVNLATKTYVKEGDRYYGKTKEGKFMSESDAIKAGYREAKTPK
jgi:helix-hairpin-helix protein